MTCKKNNLIRNNKSLCELRIANTVLTRMKGLLGGAELEERQGLLITPCNSVHTFGMKYDLDIIFLNRGGKVTKISRAVKPSRFRVSFSASNVLELKAGKACELEIEMGQILTWK